MNAIEGLSELPPDANPVTGGRSSASTGDSATAPASGHRRRLNAIMRSRLLRGGVSIALILFLLTRIGPEQLLDTLRGVDFTMLGLAVLVFLICNMVNVYKWRLIILVQGSPAPYFYLTALYYIGLFFNNFLPSNIGGDVVKAWKLSKLTGKPADAASSVVLDRVSSTLGILILAVVPALLELRLLGAGLTAAVLSMFVLALLVIGFFASERAVRRLSRFPILRKDLMGMRRHLKEFYYSLYRFRGHKGMLVTLMVSSLIYQALHILTIYLVALSLGIDLPLAYFFLFIPVVMVVALIPVSLNGVGMREGAWVLLFGQVGLSSAEAFSMSILSFLVMAVVSLAGGVFYLLDRGAPAPHEQERFGEAEAGND